MTCSRLYVRDTTPGKDRLEGETLNAGSCRQPGKGQQGLDGKESIYTINSWWGSSTVPGFELRSLGGAYIQNCECSRGLGCNGTHKMHSGLVGGAAEGTGWSWSACVCVSDGDPLSDVGCSPLFHSEAALVEVPSDLDLVLCCHCLCHLPSYPETTSTDNPKVRIQVVGKSYVSWSYLVEEHGRGGFNLKILQFLSSEITWQGAPPKQADWETYPHSQIKTLKYFLIACLPYGLYQDLLIY